MHCKVLGSIIRYTKHRVWCLALRVWGLWFGARTVGVILCPYVRGPDLRHRYTAEEAREAENSAVLAVRRVEALGKAAHALFLLINGHRFRDWGLGLGATWESRPRSLLHSSRVDGSALTHSCWFAPTLSKHTGPGVEGSGCFTDWLHLWLTHWMSVYALGAEALRMRFLRHLWLAHS